MSCIIKDVFFEEPFEGVDYELTVHLVPILGKQLILEHEFILQSEHRISSLFIDMKDIK